jgi:hypothetical protein
MKWLTPILATLLLVGCSCNKVNETPLPPPFSEQYRMTVDTERQRVFDYEYRRGPLFPRILPQPQPELQSQPTKDEQVRIQERKIKGYRAKTDPATGKITTYPVHENEKK